jgi:glutathione S-transferase
VALEEAGAIYDVKRVRVHKGETQSAEYLAVNPRGRVPALRVDETILTESCAILAYVAELFPEAALMPRDRLERMQCLSLMAWFAATVHPCFAHIVKPHRFAADQSAYAALIETGTRTFWQYLQEIDSLIGENPWILGSHFSVCDGYALPFWGFGRRIRLPMHELTRYTAWKERMIRRPAVLRVLQKEESLLLNTDS